MCQITRRDDATIIRRKGAGSKVEVVVEVAHTAKASEIGQAILTALRSGITQVLVRMR